MTVALLSPDQAEFVEAVARRVVELLDERERPEPQRLVDAAEIAKLLGISRPTVYEHADELGAVRMGSGPRSRLRFDPERARAAWTARDRSEESEAAQAPSTQGRARHRRRTAARSDSGLLPIRAGKGAAG